MQKDETTVMCGPDRLCPSQQASRDDLNHENFCAGFSSMFCLTDFPASATSAYSPIGAAPHRFLFAGCSDMHFQTRSANACRSPGSMDVPLRKGPMRLVERLTAKQLHRGQSSPQGRLDSL